MIFDNTETNPDLILANYQTRRKEVLYIELLLALDASARGNGGASSGGAGGGVGGSGGGIFIDPEIIIRGCFSTDTRVLTPRGVFNFRELYERFTRGRREVYSFDKNGLIRTDFIENIWHQKGRCLTLVFEKNKVIRGTRRHLVYPAFDEKKALGDFKLGETSIFRIGDCWKDLKLLDVIEPTEDERVWNMAVKYNHNYIQNDMATSNRKRREDEQEQV